MADVEFENVGKSFGGGRVIHDFTLAVEDGELVVLVGPSGCGKSTLLRMVAGLEAVTRGEIRIGGRVVNHLSPQARNIAMVFQNYALYPHMTVRRNLQFPLRMRKTPPEEMARKVDEAAETLGLTDLLDRTPRELSGGQRQRIAMGRAIVRDPAVFLMDEPLSNLDAKLRTRIRTEIERLQERLGTTTIYVTHDQVEAMTLGQRVAVLHQGRLQQTAPPQQLYDAPANTFVAGFIGSPSMSIFSSRLSVAEGAVRVRLGGRWIALAPERVETGRDLKAYDGAPVRVGLRPEGLVRGEGVSESCRITVDVRTVERLGHEMLVYGDLPSDGDGGGNGGTAAEKGAADVIARLTPDTVTASGDRMALGVVAGKIYLFDEAGRAL